MLSTCLSFDATFSNGSGILLQMYGQKTRIQFAKNVIDQQRWQTKTQTDKCNGYVFNNLKREQENLT